MTVSSPLANFCSEALTLQTREHASDVFDKFVRDLRLVHKPSDRSVVQLNKNTKVFHPNHLALHSLTLLQILIAITSLSFCSQTHLQPTGHFAFEIQQSKSCQSGLCLRSVCWILKRNFEVLKIINTRMANVSVFHDMITSLPNGSRSRDILLICVPLALSYVPLAFFGVPLALVWGSLLSRNWRKGPRRKGNL